MEKSYELIIIGGGPAGLAAALAAGRARIRTQVIDGGAARNAAAPHIHTFLNSDHLAPMQFRQQARDQMARYSTVAFRQATVSSLFSTAEGLVVQCKSGISVKADRILLAMGLVDDLPAIEGLHNYWGKGVHHCPYCDGFEYADQSWGLLAHDDAALSYALFLTAWSSRLTVFLHTLKPEPALLEPLREAGIRIESDPIARVLGREDVLTELELTSGKRLPVDALWIHPHHRQTSLVSTLGLKLDPEGAVARDERGETNVPGVFAAGDLCATKLQQAILAAADGTSTAYEIIHELVMLRLQRRGVGLPPENQPRVCL